jgi:hypothetical protein
VDIPRPFLDNSETINGTTPVARQQILNNATVGLQQWKSCLFYVVHVRNYKRDKVRA